MAADRIRLIVAAALFLGWLGWLAYLALTASNPIILSRPQFLVADAWVVAEVAGDADHPRPEVTVAEVVWADGTKSPIQGGQSLTVLGLNLAGAKQHWHGTGRYLLPLTGVGKGNFALTPIPDSPGFPARRTDSEATSAEEKMRERLRIYPENPQTREQVDALRKAWKDGA